MPRRILFVVGQSATVAYLAPLWRRWLARREPVAWRVLAASPAAQRIEAEGLNGLPIIRINSDDAILLEQALAGWQPECIVMSASHAPVERAAIDFARRRAVSFARIVDTWYGYRSRLETTDGALDLPGCLIVIDRDAAAQAEMEGIPAEILATLGHPAWEVVQPLSPGDRRDVLFVSQPIRRHYGLSLGYTESTIWQLFYEVATEYPALVRKIFYTPHPEDDMPPPTGADVTVVKPGSLGLPLVGTVVGMFSSLMIDALLTGRHVVSLQSGTSDRSIWAAGYSDLIPLATSKDELRSALHRPAAAVDALRHMLAGSTDRLEKFCMTFAA